MSVEFTKEPRPETEAEADADTSSETDDEPSPVEEEPSSPSSETDKRSSKSELESEDESAEKLNTDADPDVGEQSDGQGNEETESESEPTGPPAVFRAAIQGGEFKSLIESLRALVDEARVHISETGIQVRAIDAANVAMDDFELTSAAFESFEATPGVLGLNLERLASIVKMAKKGDLIQISFDIETRKLLVVIDGVEFTIACLDPDTIRQEPELPELELNAQATIPQATLSRGVKAADMVSDHIAFEMNETDRWFALTADGDTDDIRLTIDEDELTAPTFTDAETLFSLDYITSITKTIPSGREVTLRFGTEFPLLIEYDLADGNGHAVRMVAPRVQSS